MIVLYEDQPPEPADPWEQLPLPATYDDYPIEEPPPSPADCDRAARAWEADRLTRGAP